MIEPIVQIGTAGVMGERGRAEQQEDQDNPHHHRGPTPFSQRLRFCAAAAAFFGSMLTGLGRGPEPAPLPVTAAAVSRARQAAGGSVSCMIDRKSTRLNSSHSSISYAV